MRDENPTPCPATHGQGTAPVGFSDGFAHFSPMGLRRPWESTGPANRMSTIPPDTFTTDDVLSRLRAVLHETFEIDPAKVTPEANLFTDLELDSIDAIDLAIQVQDMTGARIRPEDFKSVRTVGDVVATVQKLIAGHV